MKLLSRFIVFVAGNGYSFLMPWAFKRISVMFVPKHKYSIGSDPEFFTGGRLGI